jgi:hypothetical protein
MATLFKRAKEIHFKSIGLGIVLIVIGKLSGYTFYTEISGNGTYYNLNICMSLGLVCIIVAAMLALALSSSKKAFFEVVTEFMDDFNVNSSEADIEITETYVKTRRKGLKQEIHWNFFTNYKFKDGVLFLIMNNAYSSPIAIDHGQMNLTDFQQLLEFVKLKLPEKK